VFIAGVDNAGDELFTGVNENSKRPELDTQGPEETDSLKNLKSKISCQASFKGDAQP
jgi:hypothetical protein